MWVLQTPCSFNDSSGRPSYSASLEDTTLRARKVFFLVFFSSLFLVLWPELAPWRERESRDNLAVTRVKALGGKTVKQYRQALKAAGELRKKPLTSVSISRAGRRKSCGRETERVGRCGGREEKAAKSQGRETSLCSPAPSQGTGRCLRPRVWTQRSRARNTGGCQGLKNLSLKNLTC